MSLRKMPFLLYVILLFTVSNTSEAIFASVKSMGMAGTAIAYPLDTLSIAYNPAGILCVGDRLDLEAGWLHHKGAVHIHNNINPVANCCCNSVKDRDFPAFSGGFVTQLCLPCFPCWNFAVGIAAYERNFQKTNFSRALPLFGTSRPGLEYLNYTIAPAIAFEIAECHAFGISIDWQIERIKVNGLQNLDIPVTHTHPGFTLHEGHVTNRGYNYAHGVTATFGWRSQICDSVAIGATYRPKTHMSRMNNYKGFLADGGRLDIPAKAGFGIAFYPWCQMVVAFDVEWVGWHDVHSLSNRLLHHNELMALGSKHGPGFGFRDQWYYRVGIEYALSDCFIFRAGFRHANTPIRSSQIAVNALTLDLVQNFLTVGATYKWNACNEFSFFFAYGFPHRLSGDNVIPTIPFGGGDVSIKETRYAAGIAWGFNF